MKRKEDAEKARVTERDWTRKTSELNRQQKKPSKVK